MKSSVAAKESGAFPSGHVGPVFLSETGRMVWWTGRVAIGLRYEPPRRFEATGRSAEWIQGLLLASNDPSLCA
jgi:hypothetical protein